MKEPNAMSFHVKYKPEDFMPANEEEKQSQVIMRESVGCLLYTSDAADE